MTMHMHSPQSAITLVGQGDLIVYADAPGWGGSIVQSLPQIGGTDIRLASPQTTSVPCFRRAPRHPRTSSN